MRQFNFVTIITVFCVLLLQTGLMAAESTDLSGGAERQLSGHGFLPSQYIDDPFIGTYFSNHVGAAKAVNLNTPFYSLDGELLFELKGDVAYASLGMAFQKQLFDNWAVGFSGAGLVRSGISAQALVANGADVNTDLSVWVKRRLMRTEKSQLSAGINWDYSTIKAFDLRGFSQHIRDGGSLDTAPLVSNDKVWAMQATVQWVHAFNPTFALRADGQFGVREIRGINGELMGDNRIGLLGEVDFKDRYNFPLGISLGYFQGLPANRIGSGLSGAVLGFWFTGRESFLIGVESGWLTFPVSDEGGSVDGLFGVFNAKIFF